MKFIDIGDSVINIQHIIFCNLSLNKDSIDIYCIENKQYNMKFDDIQDCRNAFSAMQERFLKFNGNQ